MNKERNIVNDYNVDDGNVGKVDGVGNDVVFQTDVTSDSIPYGSRVLINGDLIMVTDLTVSNLVVKGNIKSYNEEGYDLTVEQSVECNGNLFARNLTAKVVEANKLSITGKIVAEKLSCTNKIRATNLEVTRELSCEEAIFIENNADLTAQTYCKALCVKGYLYLDLGESNLFCELCCTVYGDLYCSGTLIAQKAIRVHRGTYVYGKIESENITLSEAKIVGQLSAKNIKAENIQFEGSINH